MTADTPRTRTLARAAGLAGLAAALALAGCKSKDGGGGGLFSGASRPKERDPLVYGPTRIPPQNVPLPDRGAVGTKGKADPLTTPAGGKTGDKTGVGYSDDPERFKGTFIPGLGSTPAALAGKAKDGDGLKIDAPDSRVPLRPAGGVEPAGNFEAAGDGLEPLYAELERYGTKKADRTLERAGDGYAFRAAVPLRAGGRRQYQAVGSSAPEAVKSVLDQVDADRKQSPGDFAP